MRPAALPRTDYQEARVEHQGHQRDEHVRSPGGRGAGELDERGVHENEQKGVGGEVCRRELYGSFQVAGCARWRERTNRGSPLEFGLSHSGRTGSWLSRGDGGGAALGTREWDSLRLRVGRDHCVASVSRCEAENDSVSLEFQGEILSGDGRLKSPLGLETI